MAKVIINKITYHENFDLNNIKETFSQIYRKYTNTEDKNKFFTIISAMVVSANNELALGMSFDDGYKFIYDKVKEYDVNPPKCVICKDKPVKWNPRQYKYNRLCDDKKCLELARSTFKNNAMAKLGTDNPAGTAEHQIAMQSGRSIAKEYSFKDGEIRTVLGMQEYDILAALENYGYKGNEIETPGPTFEYYHPILKRKLIHISDIFIPKLNLIISGKDGVENPNMHPNIKKDRMRAIYEYVHILNETDYNFIQVEGKADILELPKMLKTIEDMHAKGARYILPPRVDLAYGESINAVRVHDTTRYYFLLDEDGSIIISWFAIDRGSDKGFIIYGHDIAIYDMKNIYKNMMVNKNLFYIELDYNVWNLKKDIANYNIKTNHQMFRQICTGIVDNDTYMRKVYLTDILDVTKTILPFKRGMLDGFYTQSKEILKRASSNMDIMEIDKFEPLKTDKELSHKIYFYYSEDMTKLRISVFNHEVVLGLDTALMKVRESLTNKGYNGYITVDSDLYFLFFTLLCNNKGTKLLQNSTLDMCDISFDISDIFLILLNTLCYNSENPYILDAIIECGYIKDIEAINNIISEYMVYKDKSVKILQKATFDRDIISTDDMCRINNILTNSRKNNKMVKQYIDQISLIQQLRRFAISYIKRDVPNSIPTLILNIVEQ